MPHPEITHRTGRIPKRDGETRLMPGGPATVATEEACTARWNGGKNGVWFRCYFCGKRFKSGDVVRWLYTNSTPGAGGNPLVCEDCDGDDIVARWKAKLEQAKREFWWHVGEEWEGELRI